MLFDLGALSWVDVVALSFATVCAVGLVLLVIGEEQRGVVLEWAQKHVYVVIVSALLVIVAFWLLL